MKAFLEGTERIHVAGIGGIGVSALAKLMVKEGKTVTGSDLSQNETTAELEALGIRIARGHAADNLPADAQLLVYSDAVPESNPERYEARARGLKQVSYFELLGELTRARDTVAVAGTNGKSTTTALLGLMLADAGQDPTVIVGSKCRNFPDRNLRLGGDRLVVEACEHHANILKLSPHEIVLTNIEEDHLDFYRDLDHIRDTFQEFVSRLPKDALLVMNADDPVSRSLKPPVKPVTFGLDNEADYRARDIVVAEGRQQFEIIRRGESLGRFSLPVPGRFNVANALAAATAAIELGTPVESVRKTMAGFPGIWRRFEKVGERGGAPVYSDYGHHPTAVAGTLDAAREFFPERRLVLCFQPHQRNRTRKLFDGFVASLDGADVLLLPEIYDVAGRDSEEDKNVSSLQLAEAVRRRDRERGREREVAYSPGLLQAQATLEAIVRPGDVVIVMGAGDVYRIAEALVVEDRRHETLDTRH